VTVFLEPTAAAATGAGAAELALSFTMGFGLNCPRVDRREVTDRTC
jgi:hypothetical protein